MPIFPDPRAFFGCFLQVDMNLSVSGLEPMARYRVHQGSVVGFETEGLESSLNASPALTRILVPPNSLNQSW